MVILSESKKAIIEKKAENPEWLERAYATLLILIEQTRKTHDNTSIILLGYLAELNYIGSKLGKSPVAIQ